MGPTDIVLRRLCLRLARRFVGSYVIDLSGNCEGARRRGKHHVDIPHKVGDILSLANGSPYFALG